MATSLQQQLATIAANSTHQLDLKAQKTRHSKSLLFEPRDAASQSFDTIFQICYEGFEELCMLDARFQPFARTLFSDHSKNADRTQMTAAENEDLDRTIKSFFGLVCGRLLLKPAMKAVEWLVRRFAAHENETEWMLLTFLPYHTSHIFPTLLSILPEQLPASFRFLHPYVASLQSPPRHAVLAAASSNQGFFTVFSDYVLKTATSRYHSAVLLGFWASITAQAVNGMIDSTRSGRESIRKQREEDLLLRILPILNSAFSIKDVPELYLGSCMIMTILATKASLEDKVLDAMMEAVATGWSQQTVEDGLICLSVMAEEKQYLTQPRPVTRAILKLEEPTRMLDGLSHRYRTDKLILSTCLATLAASTKSNLNQLEFTKSIIDRQLLSGAHLGALAENVLLRVTAVPNSEDPNTRESLVASLGDLMAQESMALAVQQAASHHQINLSEVSEHLMIEPALLTEEVAEQDESELMEIDEIPQSDKEKVEAIVSELPALADSTASFLDAGNTEIAIKYDEAFKSVAGSDQQLVQLLNTESLQKAALAVQPTFLSYLASVWVGATSIQARARALDAAAAELKRQPSEVSLDLQALVPYVIAALADSSQRVRKAAATTVLQIVELEKRFQSTKSGLVWCKDNFYGSDSSKVHWLSSSDAHKLVTSAIAPILEDCILDNAHITRSLADALNGVIPTKPNSKTSEAKELKSSIRVSVCTFLASHVAVASSPQLKTRLLGILKSVGKTANDARKTVLLPFVNSWRTFPADQAEILCENSDIDVPTLDRAILGSLSHRSPDELQALKSIAAGEVQSRQGLSTIALNCLRKLWPYMKTPSQISMADFLLDLVIEGVDVASSDSIQAEALEIIRNLHFSSEVLAYLVESLPSTVELQEQTPPTKKRRTSRSDASHPRLADPAKLNSAIRKITIVLEAVESSKPAHHPQLLKGLFHLLGELHHYKVLMGSQLVYLQELLMGCLLSVVSGLNGGSSANIDRSVIRADLIVECVRTTSSTQVHNTALLLISNLAKWAPDLVLHSVMPLFTFMSTTLLRQSDEYSAHVTDQTVAQIVPPLAASLKKRGKDLVSGAAELLLSFTAAFEHIPLHRRAGLFQHLVATLGAEETLFAVVAMLVERYPEDSRTVHFAQDLMSSFPVFVQLTAFKQYMSLVFDCLRPKRTLSDTILGFGEKDAEQIEDSVDTLLEGLSDLLQSNPLRKRLAKELSKDEHTAKQLQAIYADLLEQVMQLSRDLALNEDLKDTVDSVLASLLALTPTKDFIESSAKLMQTGSDQTRQQVFRSLEARVSQAKRGNATLQQVYIEVLPNCGVFIHESQPVATRHCAITCIDQIVEKYGKTDRAATLNAAQAVAGKFALGSDDVSLQVTSLLCLASMVEVLEDEFVSILPQVITTALTYLNTTLEQDEINVALHEAIFSFINAVLDHIPWMMASDFLDTAIKAAAVSAAKSQTQDLGSGAQQFTSLAARKISPEEFFAAVERSTDAVYATGSALSGPAAASQHLAMISQAIEHHSKATVTKCAQPLFAVMLKSFDLRNEYSPLDDEEPSEIRTTLFQQVDQLGLQMTLKLNDATFRPFFIRAVEWASTKSTSRTSDSALNRLISLYSFSGHLFEQLKSIVTSYASFLLENATGLLSKATNPTAKQSEVLTAVLTALSASFRHDQDDFWQAPAHFDAIALPLLRQLEISPSSASEAVIPAITELAAAASSPDHHKALNSTIMKFMRHEDAAVRLNAVLCERAITAELNFDWLALLPEMLPFISELQEDDDESVERETLRWVKQIEDVTGESLEGMLQ